MTWNKIHKEAQGRNSMGEANNSYGNEVFDAAFSQKSYVPTSNPNYEMEYQNGEVTGLYDKRSDIIYPREQNEHCGHELGMCMVFDNFNRGVKLFTPLNAPVKAGRKIYTQEPRYVEI